ncbi:tetratricopeptide repeat protein [Anaeromyxobacter diazotrophicus]|uniref:Tetratricopeptide repeat protein n=1 Tax=Anaeromyxobacter diazotrophicus TaxID=2590199 RepID=A0A7I9VQ44_9BACT|nr:tetratricopeptide repeat protein [Anaeromyxobacter diazotrophicus]GEJ58250.1 hypothetical protein AMYX_29910 [Anaeromyxobacter diazotrophicus]
MARIGWCLVGAAALLLAGAARAEPSEPPAPELPSPAGVLPEAAVDALPPEDPRRPDLLLDLALARHAEAEATEAEERRARDEDLARWRAGPPQRPAPANATPRGDVRRAEAVRLAERALEAGQELPFARAPEALLVAGGDADRIGRGRDALRWLGRLVRRYPESPLAAEGWLALGEHHLREGDLTRARAAFEVAARAPRPALRAWAEARLAEVALGATDAEGALAALRRGLAARSAASLATLDRLAGAPERLLSFGPGALLALADLLDATGAPGRALALRERALRAAGAAAPPRARAELERARRLTAAAPLRAPPAAQLEGRVAPLRPSAAPEGAPPAQRLAAFAGDASALGALAREALAGGRAGEARLLLERALAAGAPEGPEAAGLHDDLAAALWALGDAAGARAELERALALAPALPAALENAGLVALAARDPARAVPLLERAVAAEPGRWRARLLHARALAALGRPAEALAEAERVLAVARGQADALQLAAGLREAQAETGDADPRLRSRSSL